MRLLPQDPVACLTNWFACSHFCGGSFLPLVVAVSVAGWAVSSPLSASVCLAFVFYTGVWTDVSKRGRVKERVTVEGSG